MLDLKNKVETNQSIMSVSFTDATKTHIRGSVLLLVGRAIAMSLNFVGQVLIVRYLSMQDYGAFAYALSIEAMAAIIAIAGLDKAIVRFIPIYHEQKDYSNMFGSIVMVSGVVLGIGLTIVLLVFGLQGLLAGSFISDPLAVSLLLILVALAPLDGLDNIFMGILAVFAKPTAIFFRRHILGPVLKLAAVLLVILLHSNVYVLSVGYLLTGIMGLMVYVIVFYQVLQQTGLLQQFHLRSLKLPSREIFGFSFPLLTDDVVQTLKSSIVVIFLERFSSITSVAEYRAVVPVAGLILIVFQSFKFLYTAVAARLFARNDQVEINKLYWRTAVWISVLSFPLFVVCFSFSKPLTILLFGDRYAQSGVVLALLSLGNYFNAALGFNSYTLQVYGRVAFIVAIDLLTLIIGTLFYLLLIPRYGSMGAAAATCATVVLYNLLNHCGLLLRTGIKLFQWQYLRTYASIIVATGSLLLFQEVLQPNFFISLGLVGLVSLAIIRYNRAVLDVDQMFPEIRRIPLVKPFFGL